MVAAGWGLGNGAARALYSIFGASLGARAAEGWGASLSALAERPTDFGISVLFVAMGLGGVLGAPLARRFNSGAAEGLGARMGRSLVARRVRTPRLQPDAEPLSARRLCSSRAR